VTLRSGTRFGPFEITDRIGAGGMGEVYKARDTNLRRDVAVKVLPPELSGDRERSARFEREAQTLASLNHPHIAQIYGLEEGPASSLGEPNRAIVMELVDGDDLSDRVKRGPMPVAEAIAIARQIADAIGAAHDAGIVHRDLKPSNIRIRRDGVVKVLDFGLAKPQVTHLSNRSAATTTSITVDQEGLLGTPAYMSPEQARGQPVDARSDIWAFGCILYEMLTGRRAFDGATSSETIAKVIEREPNWEALPASTPPEARRLLTRCLVKDPKRRLHALADALFDLEDAGKPPGSGAMPPRAVRVRRVPLMLIAAAAITIVAAGSVWQLTRRSSATIAPAQVLSLTSYRGMETMPTFSPDGKQVAFSWEGDRIDNEDIYVLLVGSDLPHRLTTDAARDVSPAWKPDGSQIAFARIDSTRTAVYVVSPLGGSEQRLVEFPPSLSSNQPQRTGDPFLSWSPDGRWLVISRVSPETSSSAYLIAHDGGGRRTLLSASPASDYTAAAFSPKGGALAYVESGRIGVVEIDPANPSTFKTPPRILTEFQGYVAGLAWTADGQELLYGRAPYAAPTPSYIWRLPVDGSAGPQRIDLAGVAGFPAVAATGRLAFSRRDVNVDMVVLEAGRDREPIAASTFNEFDASFSPDGSKIAFSSDRTGEGTEIWIVNRDGSGRRPVTRGANKPEGSPRWSPDGNHLAFDGLGDDGQRQVFIVDQAGGEIRPIPQKRGAFDQVPSWSRDGIWVYFGSTRSGQSEIWRVRASGGEPEQMTTNGGGVPMESADGRTLYYSKPIQGGRTVFAKPVGGGPEQSLGVDVVFWNYFAGKNGLYYTSLPTGGRLPYTYEVRLLDAAGKTAVLQQHRLASMSPGLSVTPDGTGILIAGVAEIGQDLLRIENFR
jgi:eukaryotic-like serine/threonine-protein kinase